MGSIILHFCVVSVTYNGFLFEIYKYTVVSNNSCHGGYVFIDVCLFVSRVTQKLLDIQGVPKNYPPKEFC